MAFKTSPALLAAILAIAGPAFAQEASQQPAPATTPAATDSATDAAGAAAVPAADTTPTPTPAEAASPAADAAPATTTETPAEVPAATTPATEATPSGEPQVGEYYVKSTHSDWTIRCIKADQGVDPCELYQLMKDGEGNSVAEMTMIPLGGEVAAGATLVAPLETDLISAINFRVDSANPRVYPFNFCTQIGCISRMGFTSAELTALKRGGKATVTLLPFGGDPNNPVNLELSLAGFTASMDEVAKIAEEARAAAEAAPASDAPAEEAAPASN